MIHTRSPEPLHHVRVPGEYSEWHLGVLTAWQSVRKVQKSISGIRYRSILPGCHKKHLKVVKECGIFFPAWQQPVGT